MDETVLLLDSRVVGCVASVRLVWIVVIVCPLSLCKCQLSTNDAYLVSYEVVCKLESREVRIRILKVNDDELFVFVGR